MRDLLIAYKETRQGLQKLATSAPPEDESAINSMISDCTYVIEWLQSGRRPGARRGVDRRAAYDREVLISPEVLARRPTPSPARRMEDNDYNRLLQVLAILSSRELTCFEMHHVGLWSEYEIADHLNISRDSVHEYLARAHEKIKNFITKPIQMELFPVG